MEDILNPSVCNVPSTPIDQAISLSVQFIPMVFEYLGGSSLEILSVKYNMPIPKVSEFLNRREVRQFIATEMKNYKLANRRKRIDLLTRAVDEKIEFADENEMPLSNKDIVEILKLLREEAIDISSEAVEIDETSGKQQYINIINQLKVGDD